jgi:hypothetical protein
MYVLIISLIRSTCPAHHIQFDLINVLIFGEAYQLLSSSLCHFLQPSFSASRKYKLPHSVFFPYGDRRGLTAIQNNILNYGIVLYCFNFYVLKFILKRSRKTL